MSGVTTRTSRFWIVGLLLIAAPLAYLGIGLLLLKEKPTIVEGVLYGLIILAGFALLDLEVARDLFNRLTRLRKGGRE